MSDRYEWKRGELKVVLSSAGYLLFQGIPDEEEVDRYPFYATLGNEDLAYGMELGKATLADYLSQGTPSKDTAEAYLGQYSQACKRLINPDAELTTELCLYAKSKFLLGLKKQGILFAQDQEDLMFQ